MPGLDDYGALLRSGTDAFNAPVAFQVGLQAERLNQQLTQAKIASALTERQRAAEFQQDLASAMSNPDAKSISALIMKYPEFADQIKGGWDVRDKAANTADLTTLGEIYSAGSSGKWDLAAKLARQRLEADRAAGNADPADEAIVQALESGDETDRKAAMGMIGVHIAAKTGPEHFGTVYGGLKGGYTLQAGDTRFDDSGNIVAKSPYLKDAAGNIYERDDSGEGGGPPGPSPSGEPTLTPGGADHAIETVLDNEGGYSPSDMNGKPVNFGINQGANPDLDVKSLTRDQAKQIYLERYWKPSGAEDLPANLQTPYFDVYVRNPKFAKKALAQSGGDPAKFMALSSSYFQSLAKKPKGQPYAKAWANRDANNTAIATGTPQTFAHNGGNAPPGYHLLTPGKQATKRVLTPAEAKARGLPTNQSYQIDESTGDISPISGTGNTSTQFRILTPAEKRAQGLDVNTAYQVNTANGQITALGGQQRQSKQITPQVQAKAQPSIDVRDTMARLAGSWRADYGGHAILGDNLNVAQRILGNWSGAPEGMANWWADFQNMDNLIRNQLFGSALTEHEKQAYAATTITPRMDPKEIVKRFNTRRNIINAVVARQQNFLKKNGYDPEAVDALFQPLGGGETEQAAPVRVGSVEEARKLPTGTLFVTPDGRTMRKR